MRELYIVAENAFTVTVADGLPAWEAIRWRFSPFAAASDEKPVLAVDIQSGPLPVCGGERIYEPVHAGVGVISARASRMPDGSLVLEFKHIAERKPRVWMKMPPELDMAEIRIAAADAAHGGVVGVGTPVRVSGMADAIHVVPTAYAIRGDVTADSIHAVPTADAIRDVPTASRRGVPAGDDVYFLTHALMIAFMLATGGNGTLLIHSSAVVLDGKAYLFQGKSGTGKSTHASMWLQNIEGAELLNDDHPIVRLRADGTAMAYGSPWSGKTHCYRNVSAPIGAFVRIVRAKENELHRLAPLKAYASLTTSVFYAPFVDDGMREMRHKTLERIVGAVPVCEMHCRPDADAAFTCMEALTR